MFNKVILVGRLCTDAEVKTSQSGTNVCGFRIAVNRRFTNKQTGEREADFFICKAFGNTAEFVSRYFHKGSLIIIDGEVRNNNYEDKSGVKHYSCEIYANQVSFGGTKQDNEPQGTYNGAQRTQWASQQSYGATPNVPYSEPHAENIGNFSDFEDILSEDDVPF